MPLNQAILKTRYQILPDRFSITLTPKNPSGTAITSIQGVTNTDWNQAEIAQYAAGIEADRRAFVIPLHTLRIAHATAVPVRGWWITDADGNWTIKSVNLELQDTMYRCACIKNV